MALFKLISLLSLALVPLSLAHFVVNTPPPVGGSSNVDNEDVAPCGGFTPSSSDNLTDFHVGGDAISLTTLHAQSYFAFLGTLGTSLSMANWTFLVPTVEEYGLNSFCEPSIAVPASWAGSSGLLQIVQDAPDGVHYQCMHVNFVAGVGTPNAACTNSSGVSAQFAADPVLATADGQTPTAQATSSSTSSAPASPSPSKSAAVPTTRLEALTDGLLLMGLLVVFIAL